MRTLLGYLSDLRLSPYNLCFWDSYLVLELATSEWLCPNIICEFHLSQTSFGYISIKSSTIPMVLIAPKSSWKDLSIDTSYVLKQSIVAEILGRSTGNYYSTVY